MDYTGDKKHDSDLFLILKLHLVRTFKVSNKKKNYFVWGRNKNVCVLLGIIP